jgi:hypothetical protein
MKKLFLFLVLILSFSTVAVSEEETIILNCEYSKTFDVTNAEISLSSGTFSYKATIYKDDIIYAQVSAEAPCTPQIGYATELEFNTDCSWELDKKEIREPLKISRTSGEFSQRFIYDGELKLIHYGTCEKGSKLF